ncbi:flagellar motor switch protein FliG [Marimonas lutisalis]|uniref:flagellar motor switch protein FliG n=1 Tax=Marimonas lutisalis TaxID=2545756 RepID=UPI0010F5B895|nr:FliG C-terminal domain-containing protein [Marimonas lutisalis]
MANLTPVARGATSARTPGKARLDTRQKAAIIVRFLLNEGAEVPIAELPDDLQSSLTQQMGAMRYVDRDTLAAVVAEFADELDRMGLTFPQGLSGALTALEGRISPQTAARLRKEAGVRQIGDPWALIREQEIDALLPIVERESTEVAAVLMSKLPVPKAAELLGRLPGDRARRITYAISLTGAVTPDAVDRIGLSLASEFEMKPIRAFDDDPVDRLGAILNISPAGTRDEVLTGLDEDDAEFSRKVRKAIFTFVHIPARLNPVDVPKITRDVAQERLVVALAHAQAAGGDLAPAAEFILSNISKRMAEALREEIGEAGKIKPKDGEAAMTEVVAAIRDLQVAGEITLLSDEDEEDED